MTVRTAYLGLGGNLGDPAAFMAAALRRLHALDGIEVTGVSRLFRTPPWGKTDQPFFVNAAAAILTRLSAPELLAACLSAERDLKRVRAERWGPRTIDIDILDFEAQALSTDELTLPHPRLTERAFALAPLADLAPQLRIEGESVAHWLSRLSRDGIEPLGPERDWWLEG